MLKIVIDLRIVLYENIETLSQNIARKHWLSISQLHSSVFVQL